MKSRPGEFHPRNSPYLPSSSGVRPVAEFPRAWMRRRKPAVGAGFRARICPHLRAFGPRNSPQFRAFPLDNLSKNPVNLSNFTGIYRYFRKFHILERSARLHHHTGIPRIRADAKCGEMRSPARWGADSVAQIFGATRGAGSENGFRPGEAKPTGGLSSIPHLREIPPAPIAGKCALPTAAASASSETLRSLRYAPARRVASVSCRTERTILPEST